MRGFWWHLWHDPVNRNPWSLLALALLLAAGVVYALAPWRHR